MNQVFQHRGVENDNQSLRQRIKKTQVIKKIEEMLMMENVKALRAVNEEPVITILG